MLKMGRGANRGICSPDCMINCDCDSDDDALARNGNSSPTSPQSEPVQLGIDGMSDGNEKSFPLSKSCCPTDKTP